MHNSGAQKPTIGVLLEQTLGHVSHGQNLKAALAGVESASLHFRELPFEPVHRYEALPLLSNWTLRSSLAGRSAVHELERNQRLDALFVHTHVPATFLGSIMDRVPTVVSIDATPAQIDRLGSSYQHPVRHRAVEGGKRRLHVGCFQRASRFVAWSAWAADSLARDYGVDRDLVTVVPPGVIPSQWRRPAERVAGTTVRLLFVGGDFTRKGGDLLVDAFERLRRDPLVAEAGLTLELHLVTTSPDVQPGPGVHVYRDLKPNSPELIALFHEADLFVLPTRGDCTPVVLAEAASAGLPAVASNVGAISESVNDGETGYITDLTPESLVVALRELVVNPERRLAFGRAAERLAQQRMDSQKNAERVLDVVMACASQSAAERRVVLTVSGTVSSDIDDAIEAGIRPLADYVAISERTGATLLDWAELREQATGTTGLLRRVAGNSIGLAHHLYKNRNEMDAVITDGEQIGLPLAAMLRFRGGSRPRHIMIAHRLSPAKKRMLIQLSRLQGGVDDVLVYSSSQERVAESLFGDSGARVHLIDFMVDTMFFQATRQIEMGTPTRRPVICAAGREFRDYPTLIAAVEGLDVDVVIASASPWSKRSDNAGTVELPPNVRVTALTQRKLREQLDAADMVVMPLLETDFQAGITTILEAMSMERPVICTATSGQNDVIVHDVTGLYVPPGDAPALRSAILSLIESPDEAIAMGKRGREVVELRADVRHYADVFGSILADRTSSIAP